MIDIILLIIINLLKIWHYVYKYLNETKVWWNNCLPSFTVNDIDLIQKRLVELKCPIVFPLKIIGKNKVFGFTNCEGNELMDISLNTTFTFK